MSNEGLLVEFDDKVELTEKGQEIGKEWQSLLLKKEPIMEIVAGLVDGSITSLVIVLSAFIGSITGKTIFSNPSLVVFAAFLTLSAVAITNFSSFLLGGITADMADILTLQNLMNYSLSDIPDKKERTKSLQLVKDSKTNLKTKSRAKRLRVRCVSSAGSIQQQDFSRFGTGHVVPPVALPGGAALFSTSSLNWASPRAMRDLTVPRGTSKMLAISL